MNYSREQIYEAMRAADKAGDADAVRSLIAALDYDQAKRPSMPPRDLLGGLVRGAGSIGATLLSSPKQIREDVTGSGPGSSERRASMDEALQSLGFDTGSGWFKGGKLGGEVLGTLGAGPAVAGVAKAMPFAAKVPALIDAIGSAGMTAGGKAGLAGMGARIAGGAVTGGTAAGLVDPGYAGTGALIGGALPPALKVGAESGKLVGRALGGGAQTPEMVAAVNAARGAGYVIPPTQAKPTLGNRLIEGLSGKLTTAQNASARNQAVTNKLAAKALGLPEDTVLSLDVLKSVRDSAGQAYDAIGRAGVVSPGRAYNAALDSIAAPHKVAAGGFPGAKPSPVIDLVDSLRTTQFDASSAVAKIKELRNAADDAFRTGNTDIARASKGAAKALEDALEAHLQKSGATDLLAELRNARQLIAKTYSVEKALNPATGTVDARKMAGQLAKGKPLSGDLRDIAGFASRFPKAAQTVEGMGSLPQTSPLDWSLAAILGTSIDPTLIASAGMRPAARSLALSGAVQNRLTPRAGGLLSDPAFALTLAARSAPVLGAGR